MTATVKELHNDTAKLLRPVIESGQTLIITDEGVPCAKIVPVGHEAIATDPGKAKARVVTQNGINYLQRGKQPITNEEVSELLAEFP
jgi:antitoxin (DNA-binding transcriptional repressor) of toxin-antitoxin stability system